MTAAPPEPRAPWRQVVGYGLALLSIAFVVRHAGIHRAGFAEAWDALTTVQWTLATLLFATCATINALAFANLFGGPRRAHWIQALAWLASLPAKYIPVGVGHIVGRGILLSRDGVSLHQVVRTGMQEQFLSIGLCIAVGGSAWAMTHAGWSRGMAATAVLAGMAALAAGVFATMSRDDQSRTRASAAVLLYAVALVPFAGGYIVLLQPAHLSEFTASLFGGTVAGTVTIVAPGGLGVREAVISMLSADATVALAGLTAARMAILVSELVLSAAGYAVLTWHRRFGR